MKRLRRLARCEGGGPAVEMAFALPVVLALTVGAVEWGRILWMRHSLEYASEETVRHKFINPNVADSALETFFYGRTPAFASGAVTFTHSTAASGSTTFYTLETQATVSSITSMFGIGPFTVRARARAPLPPT